MVARAHNALGEHATAAEVCEQVFAHMAPVDADYVIIFLYAELQMAEAELGLGRVASALARLERLLAQHAASGHPLALGLIWGERAKAALRAGQADLFEASMLEMERWFAATGTPALIAQCERLRASATPRAPLYLPAPVRLRGELYSEAATVALRREPQTETLVANDNAPRSTSESNAPTRVKPS
jgi:hypothetical protein